MVRIDAGHIAKRTDAWRLNCKQWDIEEWTLARVRDGVARPYALIFIRWDGKTWELWTTSHFSKALEHLTTKLLNARKDWTP